LARSEAFQVVEAAGEEERQVVEGGHDGEAVVAVGLVGHEEAADVEHPEAVVPVAVVSDAQVFLVRPEDVVDQAGLGDDVDHSLSPTASAGVIPAAG